jgi:hypothetical protein
MAIMSWSHYFFNEQKIKKTWHNFLARTVFCVFSGYKFSGLREILGFDQMFSILFLILFISIGHSQNVCTPKYSLKELHSGTK